MPRTDKKREISVVIPTLGGASLFETIESLNSGSIVPSEILVCIPDGKIENQEKLTADNVEVLETKVKGQVAQRSHGLMTAKYPVVLQLDDDISLEFNGLENLLNSYIAIGKGNALAPVFRNRSTGKYLAEMPTGTKGLLQNIITKVICGAPWGKGRMGVISTSGIGYGLDRNLASTRLTEVDWIPGGCVICAKEDLVIGDFYPFQGKAYSEDLIHSVLWRNNDVKLWIDSDIVCTTGVDNGVFDLRSTKQKYQAHLHVTKMIDGSPWRLTLWYTTFVLRSYLRKSVQIFKR